MQIFFFFDHAHCRCMYCLRQLSKLSKLDISWHRLIFSSQHPMSDVKAVNATDEATLLTSVDIAENVDDSDLPSVGVNAINKERPILPYSQKALETLK